MYADLKDKAALVTGAGKRAGIGYAVARKLAACGAHVVLADLVRASDRKNPLVTTSQQELETLAGEIRADFGVRAETCHLDVSDSNAVRDMAAFVKDRFGAVDVLCNNAGSVFGVPNTLHGYDEDAWLKTIDVNLNGVFRVSKAIVPLMLGTGGSIVNLASRAAKVPPMFNGAYAVSKAGVVMLTKVMAKELAGAGIRVNAVCPGVIATDFTRWRFELEAEVLQSTEEERRAEMLKTIPLGRLGSAEEVADLVVFLSSARSAYMTGQAINITGGQLMEL
jgi:NAD(P)-dependent dehydrogenase (short-subunit alcohol dehydrogenase family)